MHTRQDLLRRIKKEMMNENDKATQYIPNTLEELLAIDELGMRRGDLIERDFRWIQENGYCLDSIRQGKSTIPEAGRGAFAAKSIKMGSVIAPAPLIPITHSSVFEISNTTQLLENYCFGHPRSELSLCPLTQVVLINHNGKNPNAVLRWGRSSRNRPDKDKKYLVLDSLDEFLDLLVLQDDALSPLTLEVVATQDIEKGDEIFLDYGGDWEKAYESHVSSWDPAPVPPAPTRMECRIEPVINAPTTPEHEDYRSRPWQIPENWDESTRILFGDNNHIMWYPCTVHNDENNEGMFRATVFARNDLNNEIRHYHNVPPDAVRRVDDPYSSAQHLPNAFRHYIPMADKLFPLAWRFDYKWGDEWNLGSVPYGIDTSLKENNHYHEEHEKAVRELECGLYFAPSNIPDAGFSSYTAVPYVGTGITISSVMTTILIPDFFPPDSGYWMGRDYIWSSESYRSEFEVASGEQASVLSLALANFHPGILNMGVDPPVFRPILNSCRDPGAGAFSDYVGAAFSSKQEIKAGEELFVSYGDKWFLDRPEFGDIALGSNYAEANQIVASLSSMLSISDIEDGAVESFVNLTKKVVVSDARTRFALQGIRTKNDIDRAMQRNGTAQAEMEIRSIEWLAENGQCMDHLYLQKSTIPQAGIGAFSRRSLKKGTKITSSPLIATWGRDTMDLYGAPSGVNPTMLMLNYHFSHPNSSVYFLPITQLMGINHMSNRMSRIGANAELRWSDWNQKSMYFLERPLEDLKKEKYTTMVLDVVATRDIKPDEEIFLDYGDEWESAWLDHVRNYKSPCADGHQPSIAVMSMNKDKHNKQYHLWSEHHLTVCKAHTEEDPTTIRIVKNVHSASSSPHKTTDNFHGIRWDHEGFSLAKRIPQRSPCAIIESDPLVESFGVVLFLFPTEENILADERFVFYHEVFDPAFVNFVTKPWKSDMNWQGAFRHEIRIPDKIFPTHWMDLQ